MKNPFAPAAPPSRIKILVYGPSKAGKTWFSLTFPRVAIVDSEGGSEFYVNRMDQNGKPIFEPFQILRTKSMDELESAIAFFEADNGRTFDTLVIDSITTFYSELKGAALAEKSNKGVNYQQRGVINIRFKSLFARLTNLPINLVVIARQEEKYIVNGENLKRDGDKADAPEDIEFNFDVVLQLSTRRVATVTKSRIAGLKEEQTIPAVTWPVFERHLQTADPDSMSNQATVKQFIADWKEQEVEINELLEALRVKRFSEWTKGRKAADQAVNQWLGVDADDLVEGKAVQS